MALDAQAVEDAPRRRATDLLKKTPPPSRTRPRAKPKAVVPPRALAVRTLERRLARLGKELAEARLRHARELATVRRAADRRLTSLMRELAALRHHVARAEALGRLLAERDAAAAAEPSTSAATGEPKAG